MQKKALFLLFALLSGVLNGAVAQDAQTDSIDVLHYDLTIDLGATVPKQLRGVADIQFVLTKPCSAVTFDLICDTLRPVSLDGIVTRGFSYDPDLRLLRVYLSGGQPGDTHIVSVPYVSNGYVENYGWGGMHMDNNIHYNLGVAFGEYPHVFGRAWFPCRDNFYDKASYRFTVTSKPGWRAICSGLRQSETTAPDGTTTSVWTLAQPTPTYLVSISSADWHIIERQFAGLYGTYPALIGFNAHDSASVYRFFDMLDTVVPAFEQAFGPYRWDRIGYISTTQGSMEHASNIGLVSVCMGSTESACRLTTCHELAHAWFGNLVTCSNVGDMWFNEGGASFCEEVAAQALYGKGWTDNYYQNNLANVILNAHLEDGAYRSLSGMPERQTYGTTTYKKGALVWHSLRGVLGDSLFYASMRRLFASKAFGNIDAAALRDSLSLYSGVDLDGFFDFHVFNPGFVDYSLDHFGINGNDYHLGIRQLLRGTDHYSRGCRVPVTFFSQDRTQRHKEWFTINDTVSQFVFSLPFQASFAVVDFDHELSDACTADTAILVRKGTVALPHSYCKLYLAAAPQAPAPWVHVGHHFAHPTADTLAGIARMADRYWEVSGRLTNNPEGFFLYNKGSYRGNNAALVDDGFYDNDATLDSLCLLYRPSGVDPWQLISRTRTASSSFLGGYFRAPLYPGQYTLGVCSPDMPLMSIALPDSGPAFRLRPNPTSGTFSIDMGGYDKKFNVHIFDLMGRKVLELRDLSDGQTLCTDLPAGSYIVLIQNNFISLHSQIIIQ